MSQPSTQHTDWPWSTQELDEANLTGDPHLDSGVETPVRVDSPPPAGEPNCELATPVRTAPVAEVSTTADSSPIPARPLESDVISETSPSARADARRQARSPVVKVPKGLKRKAESPPRLATRRRCHSFDAAETAEEQVRR